MEKKKRRIRRIVLVIIMVAVALGIGGWEYLHEYYKAEAAAVEVQKEGQSEGTIYNSKSDSDNVILKADEDTDTGIIFYPGGKVEYTAYLPLLEQLRSEGYDVVLVKMPFNLAFFDMDAAQEVLSDMKNELPSVTNWYMMGHSLGGVAASSFASDHEDEITGLILLGAYDYGKYDESKTLIIYGSEDVNLDVTKIDNKESDVLKIEGGNHAWFGNYGKQDGDGTASISQKEQQDITVDKIVDWINNR